MRTISNTVASILLLAALALSGCGYGASGSPPAATSIRSPVTLESSAVDQTHTISARYTCDGKNISLPLQWGAVPAATKELAVLVLSLKPVRQAEGRVVERVSVLWAVAGLKPTLHRLAPGKLPRGAILGRNASGHSHYSICPAKGVSQSYLIALFASPRRLSARRGFSDESLFASFSRARIPFGQLIANYSRA